MGDLNQNLATKRIKEFFLETGLYDLFSVIHDVPLNKRNKTYKQEVSL